MQRTTNWLLALATAALPLSAMPGLADHHEEDAVIVLVDDEGNEVLRLGEGDEGSGLEAVPRGRYLLKVAEPGVYELSIGSPTRLELKPHVEEAEEQETEEEQQEVIIVEADDAPALLDFDPDAGDQEVRYVKIGEGEEVEVQICIQGMPEAYGLSVSITYDEDAVSFVKNSFRAGSLIPGMIPLADSDVGKVSVGGANFSKTLASGDGILGTVRFVGADGFSGEAVLKIGETQFRTLAATEEVEGESYAKIHIGAGGEEEQDDGEQDDADEEDEEASDALAGDDALEALKNDNACPACDLTQAKLQRLNLSGADLSGANLHKANLINTNLSEADLSGADLTNAQIFQTNFTGANLTGADLSDTQVLSANFTDADLTDANLDGARLRGTVFNGATWPDGKVCGAGSIGKCK
jgi:uncharacterized protein YjbI with pentapeptide repeats